MTSILPKLVIFGLELVLWPFYSHEVFHPCSLTKNGNIVDRNDDVFKCYPQVREVFENLKNIGIKMAIYKHCDVLNETKQLINMFGWDKYMTYLELYSRNGERVDDEASFKKIQEKTNIPFDKMIFFKDDLFSVESVVEDLGVLVVKVYHTQGVTTKLLNDTLKEYELKQQKI